MARKVPKRGIKRYKHAYNRGYAAGKRRHVIVSMDKGQANKAVEAFRKAYPKVSKWQDTAAEEIKQSPTDTRVFKWEGFIEAMNLIIASKR